MGNLKPGAKYIYERNGDKVYAREFGEKERTLIGYNLNDPGEASRFDSRTHDGRPLHEHIMEDKMWGEIRREARTNVTLQKALDRAIMIYKLSKDKI